MSGTAFANIPPAANKAADPTITNTSSFLFIAFYPLLCLLVFLNPSPPKIASLFIRQKLLCQSQTPGLKKPYNMMKILLLTNFMDDIFLAE
jgi:hypothetical protein